MSKQLLAALNECVTSDDVLERSDLERLQRRLRAINELVTDALNQHQQWFTIEVKVYKKGADFPHLQRMYALQADSREVAKDAAIAKAKKWMIGMYPLADRDQMDLVISMVIQGEAEFI